MDESKTHLFRQSHATASVNAVYDRIELNWTDMSVWVRRGGLIVRTSNRWSIGHWFYFRPFYVLRPRNDSGKLFANIWPYHTKHCRMLYRPTGVGPPERNSARKSCMGCVFWDSRCSFYTGFVLMGFRSRSVKSGYVLCRTILCASDSTFYTRLCARYKLLYCIVLYCQFSGRFSLNFFTNLNKNRNI